MKPKESILIFFYYWLNQMTGVTSIHAIIPQLLQLIEELGLRPGDRLPSERDLAARLGWSRNTLREALTLMASRGQLEIRPRLGIFLGGPHAEGGQDCAALLREGLDALCLVAPALAASVCGECGPSALAVLEGHTASLGRALVEENFLRVWHSLTIFYFDVAKLARNGMVEKLLADICGLIPKNGDGDGLPRIRRDALQNFFTAHIGLLQGLRSHNAEQTAQLARDSLEELRRFMNTAPAGSGEEPRKRRPRP